MSAETWGCPHTNATTYMLVMGKRICTLCMAYEYEETRALRLHAAWAWEAFAHGRDGKLPARTRDVA